MTTRTGNAEVVIVGNVQNGYRVLHVRCYQCNTVLIYRIANDSQYRVTLALCNSCYRLSFTKAVRQPASRPCWQMEGF